MLWYDTLDFLSCIWIQLNCSQFVIPIRIGQPDHLAAVDTAAAVIAVTFHHFHIHFTIICIMINDLVIIHDVYTNLILFMNGNG